MPGKKSYLKSEIKNQDEKMGPSRPRMAMYLDDRKLMVDTKNVPFFAKIGCETEIKNLKEYKQARNMKTVYFVDKDSIVEAIACESVVSDLIKKGGVLEADELKKPANKEPKEQAKKDS